jgi:zinc transporter
VAVDIEVPRYGGEKTGLLCAYVFGPSEPARDASVEDALDVLSGPSSDTFVPFVWLHFNLANQASVRWMKQHLTLPNEFYDSFEHVKSTRVEPTDFALVAVVNDVTWFGGEASEVSAMSVAVDGRMFVSARRTPLRSVDRLREHVKSGERFRSPLDLLAHLLRDQGDILAQIVRDGAVKVDDLEDRVFGNRIGGARARLGVLRRMLVRLQRLLAPEPSALFRLLNRPPPWIHREDVEELRQASEELASVIADCVALVERVRSLQEEVSAVIDERTNRTIFILTVVTVATLPMNIIPQMFGMNVGGVPLHDWSWGFWFIDALVTLMAIAITLPLVWRRDDW